MSSEPNSIPAAGEADAPSATRATEADTRPARLDLSWPPNATATDKAVVAILLRMQVDGRLAWLLGEGSNSFERLTAAYAEFHGLDVETFRRQFAESLVYERIVRVTE